MTNIITKLFNIKYPIIQGGMVWCSGYKLVSAVSNAGGLGLLGAGSMYPDVLREQIRKCKKETNKPFGVNLPLLYPNIKEHIQIIIEEGIKIVFTSAGNPKTWTSHLKEHGITVVHVVSSSKFAIKAENSGVDAIVAEGFEAGGHNGREETTTFTLIPMVRKKITIPLIAAGGIATGNAMHAALVLGADAVQMGTRFVLTSESSCHINFKEYCQNALEGDTELTLKELAPTRVLKNEFYNEIKNAYSKNKSIEELKNLLGKGRAKKGMLEGNLKDGELEIGQISGLINDIKPTKKVIDDIVNEYNKSVNNKLPTF